MTARRAVALACALVCALLAVLPAAAPAAAPKKRKAPRCVAPVELRFERKPGSLTARVSWTAGPRTPKGTRYRVLRGRDVVGHTKKLSMRVRVSLDRRYRILVRPVDRRGRVGRCAGKLSVRVPYVMPGRAEGFGVVDASGPVARIAWQPGAAGDAPIAGYRVFRDGKVYKQVPDPRIDVPISSNRSYAFHVVAVDRRGKMSPESDSATVVTGHQPPPPPSNVFAAGVAESSITLSWAPSQPARGRIVGYRVYRDGVMVKQAQSISTEVGNLYANTPYEFRVVAVDSLGYVSAPSDPARLSTTPPVPTTGRAHAFVLASTDRSFADFRAHYRQIGTVYPTYYDCTPGAELVGEDDPLITRWSLQRGVKTLPRFNCQRSATLSRILNDAGTRAYWLDRMVELVERHGYDGLSLDFEAGYPRDRDAYTSFYTELASRLHARGKLLTVVASAKTADVPNHPRSTFFDYVALARQADTVFVMGWGIHWATSGPGAQDDMRWLRPVVDYVKTIPGYEGRFVLGMQLYGMDWANGGGSANPSDAYEYEDVIALAQRVGATPRHDPVTDALHFSYVDAATGEPHEVWYTDAATQATRIQMARDAGMGVGFWRLGREDQRLWDNPHLAPGG